MEELNLQPALVIHRALRACPRVCLAALLVLTSLSLGQPSALSLIVGVLATVTALFGLMLTLVRLLIRPLLRLLGALEVITTACLLLMMMAIGVLGIYESYQSPNGAGAATLQLLISIVGVGLTYIFMYPRRPDLARGLTAKELLYGGARTGPDRDIRHGWVWMVALYASQVLLLVAMTDLSPGSGTGVRVVAGLVAAVVMVHMIGPAIVPFTRAEGCRTLLDWRQARALGHNGSYRWYVLRNAGNWRAARPHLLKAVGLAVMVPVCLYAGGTLRGWWWLVAFSAYSQYRAGFAELARTIADEEISRIESTREFTLFLRSFGDDDFMFDLALTGWRRFLALPLSGRTYSGTLRSARFEELLVDALWRYRPVLAIAGPESSVNPIGALQVPLVGTAWQEEVSRRVAACQTVVSVVAGSPGAVWETRLLLAEDAFRRRTVFLVPQEEPADLTVRWQAGFGSDMAVPEHVMARAIVVRPLDAQRSIVITASERSPVAYRMALDLAERLVARTA